MFDECQPSPSGRDSNQIRSLVVPAIDSGEHKSIDHVWLSKYENLSGVVNGEVYDLLRGVERRDGVFQPFFSPAK